KSFEPDTTTLNNPACATKVSAAEVRPIEWQRISVVVDVDFFDRIESCSSQLVQEIIPDHLRMRRKLPDPSPAVCRRSSRTRIPWAYRQPSAGRAAQEYRCPNRRQKRRAADSVCEVWGGMRRGRQRSRFPLRAPDKN